MNTYIKNTRFLMDIAHVYPARLRQSKFTRLAELDKPELYSTLILVFYLSYYLNG